MSKQGGKMKVPVMLLNMLDSLFKNKINELFNKYLSGYGKLLDHQMDFESEKKIILHIAMNGEKEVFMVELSNIKITQEGGVYYMQIGSFYVEREWLRRLGQDYLDGKFGDAKIKLNHQIGSLLIKVF